MVGKIKIVFIVLQYNVPNETLECVESILKNMKNNYKIILVDNGSEINNYELIKNKYSGFKQIDIIRIEQNLGFSKGNNYGFEYSKKKYNPEFYYFLTNDALLTKKDLLKVVEEEYKKSKFDAFGADIVELDGKHVSPIKGNLDNPKWKVMLRHILLFIAKYLGVYGFLYKVKRKLTNKQYSKVDHTQRKEDVAFQGAAILFSKKCFQKLKKPFFPETFLYSEEDILNYNRVKYHLKFVYNPAVRIVHKESATVNKLKKTKRSILFFKLKHNLKSLNIFYDYMVRDRDKLDNR